MVPFVVEKTRDLDLTFSAEYSKGELPSLNPSITFPFLSPQSIEYQVPLKYGRQQKRFQQE